MLLWWGGTPPPISQMGYPSPCGQTNKLKILPPLVLRTRSVIKVVGRWVPIQEQDLRRIPKQTFAINLFQKKCPLLLSTMHSTLNDHSLQLETKDNNARANKFVSIVSITLAISLEDVQNKFRGSKIIKNKYLGHQRVLGFIFNNSLLVFNAYLKVLLESCFL